MAPRFQQLFGICLGIIALTGCRNPQAAQRSGTYIETDDKGKSDVVTYVSAEEYERMTPQERQRLHAQVGAEVSAQLGGKPRSSPRDVPSSELDKAMDNGKDKYGK